MHQQIIGRQIGTAAPTPRTTDLLGEIIRGDPAQDVIGVAQRTGLIDDHAGEARCHCNRHLDVQRDFDVVRARSPVIPVQENILEGNRRQAGLLRIQRNIVGVVAIELHQPDGLSGPGEHVNAGEIRIPEIVTEVSPIHSGTGISDRDRAICLAAGGGPDEVHRMGLGKVIQAVDGQDRHGQVKRRRDIGRIKRPTFGRVLVDIQRQMECLFDIHHGALHIQQESIGMGARHRQSVGLCEIDERLIILGGGTKHFRELRRCQVVAVIGTGRIMDLVEQVAESGLVAQRQPDGETQIRCPRQAARWLQLRHCGRDGTVHDLSDYRADRRAGHPRDEQHQPDPNRGNQFFGYYHGVLLNHAHRWLLHRQLKLHRIVL